MIGHTFTIISTVVIVHWLGNFASRVEQDGTLKMDFRVELHSQEAKRRRRENLGHRNAATSQWGHAEYNTIQYNMIILAPIRLDLGSILPNI